VTRKDKCLAHASKTTLGVRFMLPFMIEVIGILCLIVFGLLI
jgi:hypothetical protein